MTTEQKLDLLRIASNLNGTHSLEDAIKNYNELLQTIQ